MGAASFTARGPDGVRLVSEDETCAEGTAVGGARPQSGDVGTKVHLKAEGGIVALTRQAALDYGAHKIRVNCICPGVVRTPMNPEMWEPSRDGGEVLRQWNEQTPNRRVGEAEDIAAMALYLASAEPSWTTGQYFLVDGGLAIKGP